MERFCWYCVNTAVGSGRHLIFFQLSRFDGIENGRRRRYQLTVLSVRLKNDLSCSMLRERQLFDMFRKTVFTYENSILRQYWLLMMVGGRNGH